MRDHWGYVRSFCPSCGAQYIAGQKFCQECGKRLEDERVINMESVEVVRCKDCKHTNAHARDMVHCVLFNLWMKEDFYCADGRRSE